MMKKNVGFLLWVLLSVIIASCTDVYREADSEKGEEDIVPPGETYTPEKKYNLNVVYYVPSDILEIEDWHYRLSGVTLHIQNYFYESFMRYRVDKKFGLELNDVNPEFVKIHYIKSSKKHMDMKESDIQEMGQEVLDYFKQNPDLKQSDHYLIYTPEYDGSFIKHYYPSEKEGMAFCGCDNTRFKIRYFDSARARATFLQKLGFILKTFAQSCFVTESNSGLESPFKSLMGSSKRYSSSGKNQPIYNCIDYSGTNSLSGSSFTAGTPDKIRLMIWDVRYLSGTQLFNDDYSYEPFDVDIREVTIRSKYSAQSVVAEDTLMVHCKFMTIPADIDLAGVVLFDDPWLTYNAVTNKRDETIDMDEMKESGYDAYGVYVEGAQIREEEGVQEVIFYIPMANHLNMLESSISNGINSMRKHELRFRFIGKNGMAYPHAPVSIKGPFDTLLRNIYEVTGVAATTKPEVIPYHQKHDVATRYDGFWEWE